jgi:hypothetical protein
VSSPARHRSPAQLARSVGANITNQAILQSRLNRIDNEFQGTINTMRMKG